MACTEQFKLALFSAYVVSIVAALANPAKFNYEHAYRLAQGANISTLLILAYCKRSTAEALIAAVLGVAFTLRTTDRWQGGSRWDSLLVTVGMLVILQDGFYQVLPKGTPHRFVLYLLFSCLIMPVLSSLPHLVRPPSVENEVLKQALAFSAEAYAPREARQKSHAMVYDKATDTDAGVVRVGQTVYVYFRGSSSLQNWKTNANILGDAVPTNWDCQADNVMRTHKGYTRAFRAIADDMLRALDTHVRAGPVTRVVFCGHSLGGALATMAGLFVACKLPALKPHIAVVTFGAPQVGDGDFVAFYDDTIPTSVRVVNPLDIVPRLLSAQLVHVKGYTPVGAFSFDTVLKNHDLSTYKAALDLSPSLRVVAAFTPAALAAGAIVAYVSWVLRRL